MYHNDTTRSEIEMRSYKGFFTPPNLSLKFCQQTLIVLYHKRPVVMTWRLFFQYFPITCFVTSYTFNDGCITKDGDVFTNHSVADA